MTDLTNQLAQLQAEEEAKNRKKPTAELSLDFDEEIDRLFLPDSMIKLQDRMIHLRDYAKDIGLKIRDTEIKRKIWDGRRRAQGMPEMLTPDMAIDAPDEVWAWENIIMQSDTNLLVALPKVGKTTLFIDAIAKWHHGSTEHLGKKFHGECPPVLIVGTDMPRSRWMPLLSRFGLAEKDENKQWHLLKDGPIKGLFTQNEPLHLDEYGLAVIGDEVAKEDGFLCLFDSYSKLTQPFGLSESDSNFAGPLGDLQEVIAPHNATAVVIHHSGHSRKGEGAVAASRGNTALPASVSQVINMRWLRRTEDQNDKRVVLETEGRGEDLSIIILQEEERWSLEGEASEVMANQRILDAEEELNDLQDDVLEEVRNRSEMGVCTTPKYVSEKFKVKPRQAIRTLKQLRKKNLIEQIGRGGRGKGEIKFEAKRHKGQERHPKTKDTQKSQQPKKIKESALPVPMSFESFGVLSSVGDVKDLNDTKDIKDTSQLHQQSCQFCSKTFTSKRPTAKFCSNSCRAKNHARKKRASDFKR